MYNDHTEPLFNSRDPGVDDLSLDNNLKVLDRFYTKPNAKERLLSIG